MKKLIRKIVQWAFKEELKELDDLRYMLGGKIAISADIHYNTDSWAVISLTGEDRDYIKFVSLGKKDIKDIAEFLKRYERRVVDANPMDSRILKEGLWL